MLCRTVVSTRARRSPAAARWLLVVVLVAAALLHPAPTARAAPAIPTAPAAATLLDVTISLHSKPDTAEKKAPYERIIQYFADGVYEASNGADKIRTVRIYTGGRYANKADIVWVATCHPNGNISGRGTPGLHINMCDKFGSEDFLADDNGGQGGGYTLAHEWGHYFYSMYDEYVGDVSYDARFGFPHSTDTAVANAIMNSQWDARGGHFAWLNFSTALNDTGRTAQHRVYGASAWQTLVRPLADDPRDGQRTAEPQRLLHSELAAAAPAAGQAPALNLPGDARSDLKIIWVQDVIYQIVIDHSGSMESESKLANAKTAAKLLVDLAEMETSTIGVIQFDDTVSTVQPLTPVTDQNVKNTIKAQIDTIAIGGNTAIGDAAQAALDSLLAYNAPNASPAVFLLSDGQQTAGTLAPLSVIPAYLAAGVPLYTFGYGSDADGSTLGAMALGTGGKYYYSPTSLAELSKVFQDANERVSPTVGILGGLLQPSSGAPAAVSFPVDATLGEVAIAVTYPGAQDAATLSLTAPDGAAGPPPTCSISAQDTLCIFTLVQPQTGNWTLSAAAGSATPPVDYRVSGRGADVFTFGATLNSLGGAEITYPQPLVLLAILGKETSIAGAAVAAEMTTPDGSIVPIAMRDDGVAPDVQAQDGLYSAIAPYSEDGVYNFSVQFDNHAGTAAMTTAGFAPSLGPDGRPIPLESPTPITADFVRFARAQTTVKGTQSDDHGNSAAQATNLIADNVDVPGRIDYLGDVDFFRLDLTGMSGAVVRVANLALGMNPRLRIYGGDGATLLRDADLTTDGNGRGYLALALGASNPVVYLAVSQVGDQVSGGLYDISAGPSLPDDGAAAVGGAVYLPTVLGPPQAAASSLRNGNFDEGPSAGWTSHSSSGYALIVSSEEMGFAAHSGNWAAWLGGLPDETSILDQDVMITPGQTLLTFYYMVGSGEDTCGIDTAAIMVNNTVVDAIDLCQSASFSPWRSRQVNLSAYAGQTVMLAFRVVLNTDLNSNLFIDTVSLGSSLSAAGDVQGVADGAAPALWRVKP